MSAAEEENRENRENASTPPITYRGVEKMTDEPFGRNGQWKATITVRGETTDLGYFPTAIEAANEYDIACDLLVRVYKHDAHEFLKNNPVANYEEHTLKRAIPKSWAQNEVDNNVDSPPPPPGKPPRRAPNDFLDLNAILPTEDKRSPKKRDLYTDDPNQKLRYVVKNENKKKHVTARKGHVEEAKKKQKKEENSSTSNNNKNLPNNSTSNRQMPLASSSSPFNVSPSHDKKSQKFVYEICALSGGYQLIVYSGVGQQPVVFPKRADRDEVEHWQLTLKQAFDEQAERVREGGGAFLAMEKKMPAKINAMRQAFQRLVIG